MLSLLFVTVVSIQLFGKPQIDVQAQQDITSILIGTILIDAVVAILLILS